MNWKTTVASDVERDGTSFEVADNKGNVVLEIFACDADKTLTLQIFDKCVSVTLIEWAITEARARLRTFEDGTPLPTN